MRAWAHSNMPHEARVVTAGTSRRAAEYGWKDLLTGTEWAIAHDPYQTFLTAVRAALLAGKDPGPAGNLPWLKAPDPPWRLVDQAHVFAALYYAVSKAGRAKWDDGERRRALAAGLCADVHLADDSAATACMAALTGTAAPSLTTYPFDLIRGGAVRIQQYVLESDWLPGIRGASTLLTELEHIAASCCPVADSVIYSGGGHLMAVVPAGAGEAVVQRIEALYEARTLTARFALASAHTHLGEVSGPAFVRRWQAMAAAMGRSQYSRLPTWVDHPPPDATLAGSGPATDPPVPRDLRRLEGDAAECTGCGFRSAAFEQRVGSESRRLCVSCVHKLEASRTGQSGLRERFERRTGKRLAQITRLDDLADGPPDRTDGRYLALISADGNGLGSVVGSLRGMGAFRCFAQRLVEVAEGAVFDAVEIQSPERRAELVVLGGDDMLFFVPGRHAWAVANELAANFEAAFRNESTQASTLSIAIGVAISHAHAPVSIQNEVAHNLLALAKHAAKAGGIHACSAVDLAVLDSFSHFVSDVETYRADTLTTPGGHTSTLRPFTLEVSQVMRRLTYVMHGIGHRSQLYTFQQVLLEAEPAEADLFLRYQLARMRQSGDRKLADTLVAVLSKIRQAFSREASPGPPEPSFFIDGARSAFADLMELLDFCEGTDPCGKPDQKQLEIPEPGLHEPGPMAIRTRAGGDTGPARRRGGDRVGRQ